MIHSFPLKVLLVSITRPCPHFADMFRTYALVSSSFHNCIQIIHYKFSMSFTLHSPQTSLDCAFDSERLDKQRTCRSNAMFPCHLVVTVISFCRHFLRFHRFSSRFSSERNRIRLLLYFNHHRCIYLCMF